MDVTPACSACVRADAAEQLQSFVEGLRKSFGSGSTKAVFVRRWMNVSKIRHRYGVLRASGLESHVETAFPPRVHVLSQRRIIKHQITVRPVPRRRHALEFCDRPAPPPPRFDQRRTRKLRSQVNRVGGAASLSPSNKTPRRASARGISMKSRSTARSFFCPYLCRLVSSTSTRPCSGTRPAGLDVLCVLTASSRHQSSDWSAKRPTPLIDRVCHK